jgi:hypothetical protein
MQPLERVTLSNQNTEEQCGLGGSGMDTDPFAELDRRLRLSAAHHIGW